MVSKRILGGHSFSLLFLLGILSQTTTYFIFRVCWFYMSKSSYPQGVARARDFYTFFSISILFYTLLRARIFVES